jgi:hypothetical protein
MQAETPALPHLSRAAKRKLERMPKVNAGKEAMRKRLTASAMSRQSRQYAEQQRRNNLPFSAPENFPRIAIVFGPLEKMLDRQCEEGDIDALPDGTPIMWFDVAGHWSPIAPAIDSMCATFELLARTHGWGEPNTDGMRKLGKRFELNMPIFQADVDGARASLEWMKTAVLSITPAQFSADSIEIQIRDELAAQQP